MAIDFPAAPTANQEFTDPTSGVTFVWNGTGWTIKAGGAAPVGDFVLKTGDTMSGNLGITKDVPGLDFNCAVGASNFIAGNCNGSPHWHMKISDGTINGGFSLSRFNDAGVNQGPALSIDRATGGTTLQSLNAIQGMITPGFCQVGGGFVADKCNVIIRKALGSTNDLVGDVEGGLERWSVSLGDITPEGGSNTGSNFVIQRFDDAGNSIASALTIERANGASTFGGCVSVYHGQAYSLAGGVNSAVGVYHTSGNATWGLAYKPTVDDGPAFAFQNAASVHVGSIITSAAATSFNTTSDMNLKEDLKSFDAGNIVDDTRVYDFAWKSTGTRAYGVVAQQAIEVYPQAISYLENPDGPDWWGVDYSKYVPVLLQELKAVRERLRELEQAAGIKPPTIDPKARS